MRHRRLPMVQILRLLVPSTELWPSDLAFGPILEPRTRTLSLSAWMIIRDCRNSGNPGYSAGSGSPKLPGKLKHRRTQGVEL